MGSYLGRSRVVMMNVAGSARSKAFGKAERITASVNAG